MRPAGVETNCAFRLRHLLIKTHAAQDVPECASDFFEAVPLFQAFARESESGKTDSKRFPASLANRG
jgi:hypothetical protein